MKKYKINLPGAEMYTVEESDGYFSVFREAGLVGKKRMPRKRCLPLRENYNSNYKRYLIGGHRYSWKVIRLKLIEL